MKSENLKKTNALRLVDAAGVAHTVFEYDVADGQIDAVSVAEKLSVSVDVVFKTLVTESPEHAYFVFVIPASATLQLKKAARAAGVKSVEMLPVKQLLPLTGYVHGGCSPVGMKKALPTFIDETALLYENILVSAGKVGMNMRLAPEDLAGLTGAQFADVAV